MNKEIIYYSDNRNHVSISPLDTGQIVFDVGDDDYSRSATLDKDTVKDLISSLTDLFIQIKDK
jgi:hypothetical protein